MKKNSRLLQTILPGIALMGAAFYAMADGCQKTARSEPLNLTVPLTVKLPDNTGQAPTGTVLFKKEASLAQLTGIHETVSEACLEAIRKTLTGRISTSQRGQNIYDTEIPGLGIRITVIYDKPGVAHQEWVLPFSETLNNITHQPVSTEDISFRIEVIKTGDFTQSSTATFSAPSLVSFNDNSLVVNLALTVLAAQAHCAIQMITPQVTLPPVEDSALMRQATQPAYPVGVNLQCMNTRKASINIEGINNANFPSVFSNVQTGNAAQNVGIEMLYNGSVLIPHNPLEITLPSQQNTFSLPLAVRYAATGKEIKAGKVKSQITLRITYL